MIKIIAAENVIEVGKKAADVVTEVMKNKSDAVLGLATGSSPIEMYKELIRRCSAGEISFKNVKTVNLDEYVGLEPTHDQSYAYFMSDNLFDHVDIDKKNTNLPSGLAKDPDAECYEPIPKTNRKTTAAERPADDDVISDKDVATLRELFKSKGIDEQFALELYKRESLIGTKKSVYANMVKNIDKIKEKQEEKK